MFPILPSVRGPSSLSNSTVPTWFIRLLDRMEQVGGRQACIQPARLAALFPLGSGLSGVPGLLGWEPLEADTVQERGRCREGKHRHLNLGPVRWRPLPGYSNWVGGSGQEMRSKAAGAAAKGAG